MYYTPNIVSATGLKEGDAVPSKHFKTVLTIMAITLSNSVHSYSLNDYHKHNSGQVGNIKMIESTYPIKNEHTVSEFGFMRCFQDMSRRYNVKKNLLIAHAIKRESHLNPDAVKEMIQKRGSCRSDANPFSMVPSLAKRLSYNKRYVT